MKIIFFTYLFCVALLFSLQSCGHNSPALNVDWYVGDHYSNGIINANGNVINCADKEINNFSCLSENDMKVLIKYIRKECHK